MNFAQILLWVMMGSAFVMLASCHVSAIEVIGQTTYGSTDEEESDSIEHIVREANEEVWFQYESESPDDH